MNDDWFDQYEDYMAWLADGNTEPAMDNPSDDWETCMAQEATDLQMWEKEDYNDYWFEYNVCGERANDIQILL